MDDNILLAIGDVLTNDLNMETALLRCAVINGQGVASHDEWQLMVFIDLGEDVNYLHFDSPDGLIYKWRLAIITIDHKNINIATPLYKANRGYSLYDPDVINKVAERLKRMRRILLIVKNLVNKL